MKLCPICGSTYGDRVDFCFQDGAPLVAGEADPEASGDAPGTPAAAPSGLASAADLPVSPGGAEESGN